MALDAINDAFSVASGASSFTGSVTGGDIVEGNHAFTATNLQNNLDLAGYGFSPGGEFSYYCFYFSYGVGGVAEAQAIAIGTVKGGMVVLDTNGTFTYYPPAGASDVVDSFTYQLLGADGSVDTATVSLTVGNPTPVVVTDPQPPTDPEVPPVNPDLPPGPNPDPEVPVVVLPPEPTPPPVLPFNFAPDANDPEANNDVVDLRIDGTQSQPFSVLENDNDADGDTLFVIAKTVETAGHGTVVIREDGTFTYTPPAGVTRGTDTFSYQVSDGETISEATVRLNVGAINTGPIAQVDHYRGAFGQTITNSVLRNDNDADGDTLTVIADMVITPSGGTLVIGSDGIFKYTPAETFYGVETVSYEISDGRGGVSSSTLTVYVDQPIGLRVGGSTYDAMTGGAEVNSFYGNGGDDALAGGGGNDLLVGGAGRDNLSGDTGNDKLFGGEGKDTLKGGAGDDKLVGGADADTLTGGAGRDVFVLGPSTGVSDFDKITDFNVAEDKFAINLSDFGFDFSQVDLNNLLVGKNETVVVDSARFVYDSSNRALFFDAGVDSGLVQLAAFTNKIGTLTDSNFTIYES
jgi:Ca2+-binding RTX toxin-like protein